MLKILVYKETKSMDVVEKNKKIHTAKVGMQQNVTKQAIKIMKDKIKTRIRAE